MRCQGDNGSPVPVRSQLPRGFIAVHDRHLHIHEYDIERMAVGQRAGRQIDADLSVLGNGNVGACSFQDEANQALIVRAVLGNQDRSALERELGLLCRAPSGQRQYPIRQTAHKSWTISSPRAGDQIQR